MNLLQAALFFQEAEQAVAFYTRAFGLQTGYTMPDENGDPFYTVLLKGKDYFCAIIKTDHEENTGTNPVQFNYGLESRQELLETFERLRQGGKVLMEPGPLSYCELAATVRDRFGINWFLILESQPDGLPGES